MWIFFALVNLTTQAEREWKSFCHVWLCHPMNIQSMKFFRPEYWSGKLFSSPRDLPNPGIKPRSPRPQVYQLRHTEATGNTGWKKKKDQNVDWKLRQKIIIQNIFCTNECLIKTYGNVKTWHYPHLRPILSWKTSKPHYFPSFPRGISIIKRLARNTRLLCL